MAKGSDLDIFLQKAILLTLNSQKQPLLALNSDLFGANLFHIISIFQNYFIFSHRHYFCKVNYFTEYSLCELFNNNGNYKFFFCYHF